jgi:hypothetical protein
MQARFNAGSQHILVAYPRVRNRRPNCDDEHSRRGLACIDDPASIRVFTEVRLSRMCFLSLAVSEWRNGHALGISRQFTVSSAECSLGLSS